MDDFTVLHAIIKDYIYAVILANARFVGFIAIFPLFGWIQLSNLIRFTLATALSIPLVVMLKPVIALTDPSLTALSFLGAKEFAIGLMIGVAIGAPFWGAKAAGDVIDYYRGASASNFANPLGADEATELGQLFLYSSLVLYLTSGGFLDTIDLIYRSYGAWGALETFPDLSTVAFDVVVRTLTVIGKLAFLLGGPLLIAAAIADLFFVLLARTARSINLFDLAFVVKNLIIVVVVPLYISFIIMYFDENWAVSLKEITTVMGLD